MLQNEPVGLDERLLLALEDEPAQQAQQLSLGLNNQTDLYGFQLSGFFLSSLTSLIESSQKSGLFIDILFWGNPENTKLKESLNRV